MGRHRHDGEARGERLDVQPSSDSGRRSVREARWWGIRAVAVGVLTLLTASVGLAQTTPASSKTLPDTTISPASGEPSAGVPAGDTEGPEIGEPPAPEAAPSTPLAPAAHHPSAHHAVSKNATIYKGPVETGQGMLQLKKDGWAYAQPATSARHVERVHAGKFVKVTGSTVHYLRVKLKSGATAYVPMTLVEVARPADKVFRLTKNTPVLSAPNHASKRLAEVHQGHDVHVIGTSLNYMKIRMKDGLEGFIAMNALE